MIRPTDDAGRPLPAAHKRLPNREQLEQAGYFAVCADARGAHLTLYRKLGLVRRAIDHVVDGTPAPKWVFGTASQGGGLAFLWQAAVAAVTKARAADA